jgi:hypothetical protein
MLSPNLAQLNRDGFVVDEAESAVRLEEHRDDSDLTDLELGEMPQATRNPRANRPPVPPAVGDAEARSGHREHRRAPGDQKASTIPSCLRGVYSTSGRSAVVLSTRRRDTG